MRYWTPQRMITEIAEFLCYAMLAMFFWNMSLVATVLCWLVLDGLWNVIAYAVWRKRGAGRFARS